MQGEFCSFCHLEFPDVHSQFMAALLKQDGLLLVENWVSAQEGAGAWWLGRRLRGRAVVPALGDSRRLWV